MKSLSVVFCMVVVVSSLILGGCNQNQSTRNTAQEAMDRTRPLLPPMNFIAEDTRTMSDAELSAVFAYLKSIKPVHNAVPAPEPPVKAAKP